MGKWVPLGHKGTGRTAERVDGHFQLKHVEAGRRDQDVDVGRPDGTDDGIEDAMAVVGELPHAADGPEGFGVWSGFRVQGCGFRVEGCLLQSYGAES